MSKHFFVENDTLAQGKFIVSLKIVIYRHRLGCYPDFLANFGTPDKIRDGYTTKFWYICEDENGNEYANLSEDEANKVATMLEEKYSAMIETCEDTGNWNNYPFKNLTLIYHK